MGNPMANMQPMGILASSQPLVDAVAGDAINPMGGSTLSMADGGIAKFQNGGYADMAERLRSDVAKTIDPLESYKQERVPSVTFGETPRTREFTPLGVVSEMIFPEDRTIISQSAPMGTLESESIQDAVNRIFPLEAFPGQQDFEERFAKGEIDRDALSRVEETGLNIASFIGEWDQRLAGNVESQAGAIATQLFDATGKRGTVAELRTIARLKLARPDLADQIEAIGIDLISKKEPDEDYRIKEFLSSQEALENLSDNPLAQEITAQLKQKESARARVALWERGIPYHESVAEADRIRGEVSPFVESVRRLPESRRAAEELEQDRLAQRDAMLREIVPPSGGTSIAEEEARRRDPFSFAPSLDRPDPDIDEEAPAESVGDMIARIAEEPSAEVTERPSAEEAATTEGEPGWRASQARQNAAAQVRDTFRKDTSEDQKDAQDSLKKYIEDFRKAVPDYEGKSEWEKGMDIVKMGMAIAAGESQHAITNIAKGVMATIDNFTSDDKERRAYERQIGLSAGKYALERNASDLAYDRGLDVTVERVATQDILGPDGGVLVPEGQAFEVSKRDLMDGTYVGQIESPTLYTQRLTEETKLAVNRAEKALRFMVGQEGGPTDKTVTDWTTRYREAADKAADYGLMLSLADVSGKIVREGDAVGGMPFLARQVNKFYNSLGWNTTSKEVMDQQNIANVDIDALEGTENRSTGKTFTNKEISKLREIQNGVVEYSRLEKLAARGEQSERFQQHQLELANLLIKEILGEGSKNISNIDRTLAAEIVGYYTGGSSIFADPDLIQERLGRLRRRVLGDYNAQIDELNLLEGEMNSIVNRGMDPLLSGITPFRRESERQVRESVTAAYEAMGYAVPEEGYWAGSIYMEDPDKPGRYIFRQKAEG